MSRIRLSRAGQAPPGGFTIVSNLGTTVRGYTAESTAQMARQFTEFRQLDRRHLVTLVEDATCKRLRLEGHMDWLRFDWPKMIEQAEKVGAYFLEIPLHLRRPQSYTYNCGLVFNPSNGQPLLVYRDQSKTTSDSSVRLVYIDLDTGIPDMDTDQKLVLPEASEGEQYEDPRIFSFRNRLFVSYASWRSRNWKYVPRQRIVEIDPDTFQVFNVLDPKHGGNGDQIQKNWVFFEDGNSLRYVYWASPHEVVTMDPKTGSDEGVDIVQTRMHWDFGEIRGGSCPIRIGDEFITFFHSRLHEDGRFRYFMGAYAFSAKSPFTPTRITREPLLSGSPSDYHLHWAPYVAFPGGALVRGQDVFVALGVNDSWCGLYRIPLVKLDPLLVRI